MTSLPAGVQFTTRMAVLEGNTQRLVDVTITKLNDDDTNYKIVYPTQSGFSEDVTVVKLSPFDHSGTSTTRINAQGQAIQVNMARQSDAAIDQAQIFSLVDANGSGVIEKVGVFGIASDPAEVQVRGSTANYTGDIFLAYTGAPNAGVYGFNGGSATVAVDFDALTFAGTSTLDGLSGTSPASGTILKDAGLNISGTITTGNDFTGQLSLGSAAAGSPLTALDAQMEGAFFGQGASSLGATISGSMDSTVHGTLPVIGGVVAKE